MGCTDVFGLLNRDVFDAQKKQGASNPDLSKTCTFISSESQDLTVTMPEKKWIRVTRPGKHTKSY